MAVTTPATALERFSPIARRWFSATFERPTQAQELGWAAIASGEHTLLLAPTGSGKTLAAFLWCLDRLAGRVPHSGFRVPGRTPGSRPKAERRAGVTVLYVSPLKALSYDIERNLRAPLAGLRIAAAAEGLEPPEIAVATRTGDTPTRDRAAIQRDPPDILITTPESLYLMLTSHAREVLRTVDTVIVDEIHTMAGTKRGAHLSLSLERLEELTEKPPQRVGLSATQRPLDEIARYLGGSRPVRIVDAGSRRKLDLQVIVPVEDMTRPGEGVPAELLMKDAVDPEVRSSIWPAVYPVLLDLIRSRRSTLVFVNNRRLAERLAQRINELAGEELVRSHHGSVSREQRLEIEEQLKGGTLPGLVCTSSLELGIDMGAVDLVVQVESPKSVARGLQRVGRAGHQVDAASTGRIIPKFRGDLLECAVLVERMQAGAIEATTVPKNPLDVLAQQIVAMAAIETWQVDDLERVVRRSYNFAGLSRDLLENVLGMLAGQYPSDEFADLRPRIIWDREQGKVTARADARLVAIVNGGTIPDRGLYGVFLGEGGPRVGELDEEMVYECRPGETFILGATTWRIETITPDRVIVSPAHGEPGKMPFWKGDGIGRPFEFGQAIGAFTREVAALSAEAATARLAERNALDERAARNLLAYLDEQREATGAIPDDRTIVVERFRDELGDWRVAILTPFGARVHAPWAQALERTLAERGGFEVQALWGDDGISLRFAGDEPPETALFFPAAEEVEELVAGRLAESALFAAHFRENAARALLLPRRRPGSRTPLWQQRQRSANLLAVASRYGSFPIVLETYRDCLQDVFDLQALEEVLRGVRSRELRVVPVETQAASPFARSLVFDYIAAYMYEGDAPLAERRAQALALDRNLLRDLLGQDELRELLDPAAIEAIELELQCLVESRRARNADQLHDLLRRLGDLAPAEIEARCARPEESTAWLAQLAASHRACAVRIAGEERWIPAEDAGRYRDALGIAPPLGVTGVFLRPAEHAFEGLLARYARTHVPFAGGDAAARWAIPEMLVRKAAEALEGAGTLVHGDFRPGGHEREWCDVEVLRMLRRRSLARLRREVEPVPAAAYARFLQRWHGIGGSASGRERLLEAVRQVEGAALPATVLERDILPARVSGYTPAMLDELGASGELAWAGRGSLGRDDGRVTVCRRERLASLPVPPAPWAEAPDAIHAAILERLQLRGASFFLDLAGATGASVRDTLAALWDLVWAGLVTNDTFAPLRALAWKKHPAGGGRPGRGAGIPPEAAGRWALVERSAQTVTAQLHQAATTLLDRYGIVTREAVNAEGLAGGFAALYPVLKAMEEGGRVRRGHFLEGLGAAQFAHPGAVDRLRAEREPPDNPVVTVLAATDPANPYGAGLPWPRREAKESRTLARAAGAYVVLVDGEPVLYVERGGRTLVTLPASEAPAMATLAIGALATLAERMPGRQLSIERIDGGPAGESALAGLLAGAGFVQGYRGYTLRAERGAGRRAGG